MDDDPLKRRLRIDGVQVLGATDALPRILDEAEPDEVTMAIPSASGTVRARVVRACRDRGIPVRTLPTVFELLQNEGRYVRQVRDVQVEDVLGREPVRMELDRVGSYLTNEIVLVTGAGGSIGAELCRQISRVGPRRLICLDHAEDNLFAIQRELLEDRHVHPTALAAVLADCKEEERMREVFAEHRPTVVFHAAAYKHVGLMEANPVEAVRNNAIATRVVARVAGRAVARGRSCWSPRTRRWRPRRSWARRRRSRNGRSQQRTFGSRQRSTSACASATSSAPPDPSSRSSAARSRGAAR